MKNIPVAKDLKSFLYTMVFISIIILLLSSSNLANVYAAQADPTWHESIIMGLQFYNEGPSDPMKFEEALKAFAQVPRDHRDYPIALQYRLNLLYHLSGPEEVKRVWQQEFDTLDRTISTNKNDASAWYGMQFALSELVGYSYVDFFASRRNMTQEEQVAMEDHINQLIFYRDLSMEEAINLYGNRSESNPDDFDSVYRYALLLIRANMLDKALEVIHRLDGKVSYKWDAAFLRLFAWTQKGYSEELEGEQLAERVRENYAQALEQASELAKIMPHNPYSSLYRGSALTSIARFDSALSKLYAEDNKTLADSYNKSASWAYNESLLAYQNAIENSTGYFPEAENIYAVTLILINKDHEAISKYNEIINGPNWALSSDRAARLFAYYGKGITLTNTGLEEEAREVYENGRYEISQMLDSDPGSLYVIGHSTFMNMDEWIANFLNGYAVLLNNLGEYSRASDELQKVLLLYSPNHATTHNNLAAVLSNRGDFLGALSHYDIASASIESNTYSTALDSQINKKIIVTNKNATLDNLVLLVSAVIISLLVGCVGWLIAEKMMRRTTSFYFNLQRKPILHLILRRGWIDLENYFIWDPSHSLSADNRSDHRHSHEEKSKLVRLIGTSFLVLSSAALLLYLAENINGFPNYRTPIAVAEVSRNENDFRMELDPPSNTLILKPEPIGSPISGNLNNLRTYVWVLTVPIMALFIIPIEVMDSSKVRVFLKARQSIVSPANPYKVLLGIAAGVGPLTAWEVIQRETSGLVMEFAFPAIIMILPLIPMIYLYKRRTEDRAISKFVSHLKYNLRIGTIHDASEIPK